MNAMLFLFAVLIGIFSVSANQQCEELTIGNGAQTVTKNGGITVKFLELIEDSRCPEGANCIWAGVAKIKVRLSKNGKAEVFDLNTNQREKTAIFQGYSFALDALNPYPSTTSKYSPSAYKATIEVSKAP